MFYTKFRWHSHRLMAPNLNVVSAFIILILSLSSFPPSSAQNVSFQSSIFELPVPLTNHITSTYSNELHIVGGYINGNISNPSTNAYIFTGNIDSGRKTRNSMVTTALSDRTFWTPTTIICNGQCSTTIDNKIQICTNVAISF